MIEAGRFNAALSYDVLYETPDTKDAGIIALISLVFSWNGPARSVYEAQV